jgi:RNA-dependent RNA polymerase
MIKFKKSESDSYDVEVAKWFQYPTPCYLNRPLAMILDHLGVEHEVIVNAQYQVLMEASRACTIALGSLARIVDEYGLGRPFKFNRLLLHLIKGGLHYRDLFQDSRPVTKFFERVGDAILAHLKRDVKHRARIRIPNSYTLVGVADIHEYLKPAEVFSMYSAVVNGILLRDPLVAIQNRGEHEPEYIEGEVWISRSPAVHPGDSECMTPVSTCHSPIGQSNDIMP